MGNFYTPPTEKVGDLYWSQLSMWDYSKEEDIDVISHNGYHYELLEIVEIISENQKRIRHVNVNELTDEQIDTLIPEKNHNWSRIMGNINDFKDIYPEQFI
jgi:hypothetical protein